MELIKAEKLVKDKVLEADQAKLIIKTLREGKKEEREKAIFLVQVIFSIILRQKVRGK